MDLPAISPNLNINDHSAIDDSINQDGGFTINAGAGSVINSNSGNEHSFGQGLARFCNTALIQLLGLLVVCGFIYWMSNECNEKFYDKLNDVQSEIQDVKQFTKKSIGELKQTAEQALEVSKKSVEESKEGTIWVLRRDILNSIDIHTNTKVITTKEYKRIKDQFEYYKSIGGNHDVESKWDEFNANIFGINDIKMIK